MTTCRLVNVYLYTRYERFWHWLQTSLILLLLITGFEVKGLFTLFGFKTAAEIHEYSGLTWLIAFGFFVFWLFTTGNGASTSYTRKMIAVVRYYTFGIFRGNPIPFQAEGRQAQPSPASGLPVPGSSLAPRPDGDGVPLLGLIIPGVTGVWLGGPERCRNNPPGRAFGILSFLVVHLYMITTGHTVFAHTRP